ncbi:MAG: hypothetical protein J7577_17855, partial [Sphingobacteriaceae bacterium]|nr:hypothetical protein [Sphingobacteriaceae bacterium]
SQKDITLGYNFLNLPQTVSGSQNLTYTYNAAGEKLQKQAGGTTTNYLDGIQYTNNSIDFIQTEEGLARRSGNSYSYEYNLSDHLGNVRVTFYQNPTTNQLEVLQRDDYYAFGLRKEPVAKAGLNKYLYNGKELQEELGQYDYGARFYDPVIGRWNVIDPLAEKMRRYSPYNYAFNNPIRFIDPDGMAPVDEYSVGIRGEIELVKKTDDDFDVLYKKEENGNIDKSKSITLEKGILNNIKGDVHETSGTKYDYMEIKGDDKASALFEFLAQNTIAEWSQTKFGTESNYIATSHSTIKEAGGVDLAYNIIAGGGNVREHTHSHPFTKIFEPSAPDKNVAGWFRQYSPKAEIKLYDRTRKTYLKYNENGVIK